MKIPADTLSAAPRSALRRRGILLGTLAIGALAITVFSSLGEEGALLGPLVVVDRLLLAGWAPLAYLIAAVGLGRLWTPLFRAAGDPLGIQSACGLATLLSLSHGLGVLGLLGGAAGPWIAVAIVAAGLLLAVHQFLRFARGGGWEPSLHPCWLVGVIGVAILLVAACNPPGYLWSSEFGGYDALSYHLQLPQEWLLTGRVWPVPHNVYSFLPSLVESAFVHLGAMTFAPTVAPPGEPAGLLAGDAYRLLSCQLLHAGITLLGAWLVGRVAAAAARRLGAVEAVARTAAAAAATLVTLTPWTIVTGSLAYNEGALLALAAGAFLAVLDPALAPARRGLLVGAIVGAACGAKPTALLFVGLPTGLLLLAVTPAKSWPRAIGMGAAAGLVLLAPWLIRNLSASGNPVFPFAAALFPNEVGGTGGWTAEQVARFASAHRFDGPLLRRLALLILPDDAGHRGLGHPQWGLFFPVVLLSAGLLLARARSLPVPGRRLIAALLLGLGVQVGLWLFTTHLQSRFLFPLIVPGAIVASLAASRLPRGTAPTAICAILLLAQAALAVRVFTREGNGRPNAMLLPGPATLTGEAFRDHLSRLSDADRDTQLEILPAEPFINLATPAGTRLYLLGDATPLYLARPLAYATTWDASLMGEVIRAAPDAPDRWSASLRERGFDLVLVNLSEIARLERSGWNDPAITHEAVSRWMLRHTTLVKAWPRAGRFLVAPREPDPETRPARSAP